MSWWSKMSMRDELFHNPIRSQGCLEVARRPQRVPGIPSSSRKLSRVPKCSQGLLETFRGTRRVPE
eukprot:6117889-Karenia_brevis.AAC.1